MGASGSAGGPGIGAAAASSRSRAFSAARANSGTVANVVGGSARRRDMLGPVVAQVLQVDTQDVAVVGEIVAQQALTARCSSGPMYRAS
jgi:hypothetical protein